MVGFKRWPTRTIPEAERPNFSEIMNMPGITDSYNVSYNNCQHWAQRVWVHFGGTLGWTGLY